jgi:hypothetical protein
MIEENDKFESLSFSEILISILFQNGSFVAEFFHLFTSVFEKEWMGS